MTNSPFYAAFERMWEHILNKFDNYVEIENLDELSETFELITIDDIDNICMITSSGLAYTLNNSGTEYAVSGIGTCTDTDVYIPRVYNGLPVTSIADFAFYNNSNLTSISIPNSITSIGMRAISNCDGLTSIIIPSSVTTMGSYVLCDCDSLTSVVISNGVASIPYNAFNGCSNLTSIIIPSSVTSIDNNAFIGCRSLTNLNVDTGNPVYHSNSNCIIETNSKCLVLGCKNSVIPNDGSVTSIGSYAFAYCSGLTSITIPSSVTSIGDGAFKDCGKLMYVSYGGGADKWNAISIGADNTALTNATISYAQSNGGSAV